VAETREVLVRRKFATTLTEDERSLVLALLTDAAVWVEPTASVHDCRDAKDNQYLELAAAAGAEVIVSSDEDLLMLDPWRGIRIVRPAVYLGLP
jgi:putative PIN family toxin of toxin-antitoxin system